eukprot:1297178-Rhodomonas_salina.2
MPVAAARGGAAARSLSLSEAQRPTGGQPAETWAAADHSRPWHCTRLGAVTKRTRDSLECERERVRVRVREFRRGLGGRHQRRCRRRWAWRWRWRCSASSPRSPPARAPHHERQPNLARHLARNRHEALLRTPRSGHSERLALKI